MSKEQAFQNWWESLRDRLPKTFQFMYRRGFEAGYESARAEIGEAGKVIERAAVFYKDKANIDNLVQAYLESKTDEGLANRLRVLNDFTEWIMNSSKPLSVNSPRPKTNVDKAGCKECGEVPDPDCIECSQEESGNWIEGRL